MSNTVFPSLPGLAWGTQRRVKWASRVQKSTSGKRQAIGYMSYPLYEWTIQFNVLREFASFDELATLQGFFNSMMGQVDTFLWADPHDAVASQQQFGVGNGSNKIFQLARAYGGYVEPVQSPALITQLRRATTVQTNPTHYSVDMTTGIVTFVTAPAAGNILDWTGTFRYRCAFTQDTLDLINQDGIDIWKTNKITFESVKV